MSNLASEGDGWIAAIPLSASVSSPSGVPTMRSDVREFTEELSAALKDLGAAPGDRIATLFVQGERQFLTILACAATAIATPLAPGISLADVRNHLDKTRPSVAVIDAELPEAYKALYLACGVSVITVGPDLCLRGANPDPIVHRDLQTSDRMGGTGVLLPTSGTSGEPKLVFLGMPQLRTVAGRIAQSIHLGAEDRYLCVMPCHFIHGLSTALAAIFSGGTVVFSKVFQADAVLQQLHADRITWISATPTHYRSLLAALARSPDASGLGSVRCLRSASAPMDRALAERLASRFSVPVIQAYGMTEAGPLIASNNLGAGGNKPGSVGRPSGVAVAIGEPGCEAQEKTTGDIWISGDTVSTDYWTLESPQERKSSTEQRWFQTGDIGHFDEDGFLFVSGRKRDLINAGGEKILPADIEAVLLEHPAVIEAVAYPAPHDSLGEAPHAAVVIADHFCGAAELLELPLALADEIRQHCVSSLPRSHVPHRVTPCLLIPKSAGGKLQRQGLHAYFSRRSTRSSSDAPLDVVGDQDHVRKSIVRCWQRVLRIQAISYGDNFFGLGGDSLSAVDLAVEIESAFDLSLGEEFIFLWPTVEQQVQEVSVRSRDAGRGSDVVPSGASSMKPMARLGEIAPLSLGQKRLWLLDQLGAGAEYTMCSPVWIDGEIKMATLRAALSDVVARHSALRTRIRMLDGGPIQYIEKTLLPTIEFHDLRETNAEEREEGALALAREKRAHAFDLSASGLARYSLVQLDDSRYAFILTTHHIFSDGWSVPVFFRDLFARYASRSGGTNSDLPALGATFQDYCYAQAAGLATASHREKLNWWHSVLGDAVRDLPLFSSRPGSRGEVMQSARKHFEIDSRTTQSLRSAARARGVSLYPLLMAALQVAIFAITGRSRFCVGTVTANRGGRDYDNCLGFFANTLAIPANVEQDAYLHGLVDAVADTYRQALARGDVDLSQVASRFALDRDGRSSTLLEVMFAFQSYPSLASRLDAVESGLGVTAFSVDPQHSRFGLGLYINPGTENLSGVWQYREALFCSADIDWIDLVFQSTVREIIADVPVSIAELVERTGSESTAEPRSAKAIRIENIVERIEAFAQSAPDSIAIRCTGVTLSYADLFGEIGRLGAVLDGAGIAPGSKVGVLLPRNVQAIVAPLAIWSRGATYVPLEEGLPRARITTLCEDAQIDGLLCSSRTRDVAEQLSRVAAVGRLIDFDQTREGGTLRPVKASSDGAAYIIYTSGSTGTPKGVQISFANIHFYFQTLSRELALDRNDVYLHSASPSFSSSIRQFALPLYCGASVYVAAADDVRNAARLPQVVEEAGVTVMDLVPSHWRNVLRAAEVSPLSMSCVGLGKLRLLLSASEALTVDLAAAIRAAYPQAQLVNMYGQTETAGIVLVNRHVQRASGESYVSLGQPLAGNSVAIVDAHDREVPEGTPGELIIMGPAVGMGYTGGGRGLEGRFFNYYGHRAYRSGDVVRRDSAGDVHFVGRADLQIKHRGFRIEPGDIESVACRYPAVLDAVVCLTRSGSHSDQLHLYYSLVPVGSRADDSVAGLKSLLAEHLPDYMLPTVYTRLDSLPRTPSGKVDRKAIADSTTASTAILPADTVAKDIASRLRSIWENVLPAESIALDDNFFDVGGNSLISIEVVSRARDAGIAISLEQLFQYQTINALVSVVKATSHDPATFVRGERASSLSPTDILPRYDIESLRAFSLEVLRNAGLDEDGARILTDVQLESSLRGQATHNIGDIPRYARRLSKGVLNGQPDIAVTAVTILSATVDGDNAPGQWVATVAMDKAIALANTHGIGIVGVRRSNHYGAAGQYAWQATQAGLLGLCFTNGPVVIAPTGGNEPLFGNNPLAIGIPREGAFPIVLDIAMSVATRGKIGLTVAEGKPLDAGWILDSLGMPSTSLEDLAAGLAAPIGGHKGYGLAFAIEILAGALTGSGYCADHGGKAAARHGGSDIGHLFITLKPDLLMSSSDFDQRVQDIVEQTKASRKIDDVEEIYIPGEIEMQRRAKNLNSGVPLHASTVKRLRAYGRRFGIRSEIFEVGGSNRS